jgi:hypothetical protein
MRSCHIFNAVTFPESVLSTKRRIATLGAYACTCEYKETVRPAHSDRRCHSLSSLCFFSLIVAQKQGWPCRAEICFTWPVAFCWLLFLSLARLQNRSCRCEDFLSGLGWDFPFALKPVLDVSATICGAFQTQSFETNHGCSFGFHFAETSRSGFLVYDGRLFGGVIQDDVCQFVEGRLERKLRHWTNSDHFLPGKTLNISVKHVEINPPDSEVVERRLKIEGRGVERVWLVASRLGQREPERSVYKVRKHPLLLLFCFRIDLLLFRRHRHTEGERLLALLHIPAQLLPALVSVERPEGQVSLETLGQRQERVPNAECELPDYVSWRKKLKAACIILLFRVNIVRAISRTLAIFETNPGGL